MFHKRYEGQFLSHGGVTWTVRILQEADSAFASVGELAFPAAAPLVIEWGETGKEQSVCGSTATLTVLSPGDRTYIDLYTIEPGLIRLDVLRNGVQYWSGCLDPEFYEEPYSSGRDYNVSLTFSDFGILKRKQYDMEGMRTLEEILESAMSLSRVNVSGTDLTMVSTCISGTVGLTLDAVSVRSDNFYDEDGVPMSYDEVLTGILQPLALRLVQKAGKIYLYDINALHAAGAQNSIQWISDDQYLGVDRVFNSVKVVLSAYGEDSIAKDIEFTDPVDETQTNLTSDTLNPELYSYYVNYEEGKPGTVAGVDYDWVSFTVFLSQNARGLASKYSQAKYFKTVPVLGGESSEGLALWFYTGGHGPLSSGWPVLKGQKPDRMNPATAIMKTEKVYLPAMSETEAARHMLRLTLDMMLDPRYNPYSDAEKGNEKENYDWFDSNVTGVFVPVIVEILDADGNAMCHYDNRGGDDEYDAGWESVGARATLHTTLGKWVDGPAVYDDCCLQYYDKGEKSRGTAVLGWRKNRPACGIANIYIALSLRDSDDGQRLPYPPVGGYLQVSVCAGMRLINEGEYYRHGTELTTEALAKLRWGLFKAPVVELLTSGTAAAVVEGCDDVEYAGVLNEHAKDDLAIDTVCGTMETPSPLARGLYFLSSTHAPIVTMTRQGRTAQVEQLLIGTLYSQFASRKTRLSGTAALMHWAPGGLSDASQGDRVFMLTGEVQDVIEDSSEIVAIETAPDEYRSNTDLYE